MNARFLPLVAPFLLFASLATHAADNSASGGELRPVYKVDPEFPSEAARAGAVRGKVVARMTLDASGKVTNVEIVDALPRRLFDHAVQRALADWRYAEGTAGRVVEVEVAFRQ
ncbi:MAG: TonB family protein [Bacillota bacterium]